jgi:transcriptional regulator with XRE-family HTH domain
MAMDLGTKQGRREQGLRVQRAVEQAGLSIEELAGRIGCSRALIYQYLSGSTLAQPDRLQQIASECGVALTYFYQEGEPLPGDSSAPSGKKAETPAPPAAVPQDVSARLHQSLRSLNELADAQEGPPDYRALAATCERVFFLAGQLGDRAMQARTQFRLGNACLRTADYARAAEALRTAIEIAREVGATGIETDARQRTEPGQRTDIYGKFGGSSRAVPCNRLRRTSGRKVEGYALAWQRSYDAR